MPSDAVNLVLRGYSSLSDTDKSDFVVEINKLINQKDQRIRKAMFEAIEKRANEVSFAPMGASCACCGR